MHVIMFGAWCFKCTYMLKYTTVCSALPYYTWYGVVLQIVLIVESVSAMLNHDRKLRKLSITKAWDSIFFVTVNLKAYYNSSASLGIQRFSMTWLLYIEACISSLYWSLILPLVTAVLTWNERLTYSVLFKNAICLPSSCCCYIGTHYPN